MLIQEGLLEFLVPHLMTAEPDDASDIAVDDHSFHIC
jgi:hypothetical protein